MDKPSLLHKKKWALFASVMIKIGANLLFWLSSHVMLYFNDQVFLMTKCLMTNLHKRGLETLLFTEGPVVKRNGPVVWSKRLSEVLNPWLIGWAIEEVVDDGTAQDNLTNENSL